MSFEELEHTADFLFRCRGSTKDELFEETASAMFSVMFENRKENKIQRKIKLSSDSPENLLLDFLSEILFISETENLVFSETRVKINNNSLEAVIYGGKFNINLHSGGTEIKGISRSGVEIKKYDGKYEISIIFDV
ncbi:MAG: archease [Methanomicrobiaceae archaeon]|nr:archease [Methanomicrobiaceae archaeon]